MIPERFRAHGMEWRIVNDGDSLRDEQLYGQMEEKVLEVRLDIKRPIPLMRETLIHELLHVAGTILTPSEQPSEAHIRVLGHGLFAILSDNPELVRWIWPGLNREPEKGHPPMEIPIDPEQDRLEHQTILDKGKVK